MNKTSIRILSFFLAIVMLAGMVTVPGVAPEVSAAAFLGDQFIPSAETSYLNTGFDPNTYSDVTLKNYSKAGNAAETRSDAGNYYAYFSRTDTSGNPPTLDYYTPSSVSDYIVISMDLATTTGKDVAVWLNGTSNRALHLYDANDGFGSRIRWSQNEVKDSNNNRLSTDLSGEYVNYTMVLDSVNSKFALWVDGQMVWSRTYDFGKVSRILIRAQGSGEDVKVDNLKIYSYDPNGTAPTEPATTAPSEPATTAPADTLAVYYNNDFSANADGIVFNTSLGEKNDSKYDAEGDYLYLRVHDTQTHTAAYWNKGEGNNGVLDLPNQFVVSFDHAIMTACPQWQLRIVDENGNYIRILSTNGNGYLHAIYQGGSHQLQRTVSTAGDLKYHPITLKFDMTAGTYTYVTVDGSGNPYEKANLPFRTSELASGATFGEIQYIQFEARGDYEGGSTAVGGVLIVDNMKIYAGTEVLDTVGPQNRFPGQNGPDSTETTTEAPTGATTETPTEAPTEAPTEPATTAPVDPNVEVYYNNDFSANADNITFRGSASNQSKYDAEGDYLYLRVVNDRDESAAYWNRGDDDTGVLDLPDQFVVSFDYAAINVWSNWRLNLKDENGETINVLWGRDPQDKIYFLHGSSNSYAHSESTGTEINFYSVALMFDMTTNTYGFVFKNGNTVIAELSNLALRIPDGFGTVQYIEFSSRGDLAEGGSTAIGGSLMVDNMKVYSGTTVLNNVGPQNKFPAPDVEDTTPVDVYYNNDFSSNANGLTILPYSSGANNSKVKNGYLYLSVFNNRSAAASWNKNLYGLAEIELPDQFVMTFDLAADKLLSQWEIRLVDENGKTIRVVSGKDSGLNALYNDGTEDKSYYHGLTLTTEGDMKYHTVTLAFDMAAGTYSYTFNNNSGTSAKKTDLLLRSTADFGKIQYIEFSSRDDYKASGTSTGANIVIDNLKIYGGTKVRNDVGPQNVFPKVEDEDDGSVDVYYNNNFKNNADGITLNSTSNNRSKHDAKNGYLYLNSHQHNGIVATWNVGKNGLGPIKMKDQFVITFDHAAINKWSTWEMHLVDDKGNSVRLLANNGRDGGMKFLYDDGGYDSYYPAVSTAKNIKYHPIALMIDMKTGTYAYETVDSYGNPVGKLDLKLRLPKNEKGESTFGTLRYIQFKSRGDDPGTENGNAVGGNLIIDNLKIYSGTKVRKTVGKQNVFQQPLEFVRPSAKPGNIRYINWKFEGNDKLNDDRVLMNGAEIREESNGNGYVHMGYTSRFSFNYYGVWELTDYVVWQFSVKSKLNSTLQIEVRDTEDRAFHIININKETITPYYDKALAKLKKGEWVDMAVAMNTVDKTYSVWYDGVLVAFNEKITKADFGTNGRIIFSIPYGDLKTAEAGIDNLRIYQGHCPDDFKNTIQAKEPPKDESYLDEMMGTQSMLLDYTEEELAIIKSAGAVMVNTDTLYIYKDGKRTQGTKAQVDAILKKTSGKKVIKNGLGLVIIGPKSLELTDDQIASLHDYMIYVRPSAKKLTSMLKAQGNEHPRVILTKDSLAQLRADYKNNELIKKIGNETIARAELLLKTRHIEFTDEGFTTDMNSRYQTLALAFLLTNDTRFKDYLWEDLEQTCKFPNWRTPTMLATSTGAFGVAVAYDWLYDEWTPAQRKVMEEGIYNNVLYHWHKQIYGKQTGAGTYISSTTNRNPVSNGGMGMACIAIMEAYPEKCADIMEKIYHMIEISLDDYAPSGATSEGPAYWQYTMDYYVPFLYTTINSFGTDFNLMKAPGFDTTVDYILDVDGMTGVNNFHDSEGDGHYVSGEILGLANLQNRPDLIRVMRAKMDIYGPEKSIPTMLYLDTSIKYDGKVDKALDGYYDGMEIFMMRSSWSNSAGIFVSAHNGKTGVSHDHLDSGSFVLDIGGQRFASDLGKENYNLRADQNLGYYYYRKRPEGHNVFVINPDLEKGEDLGMKIGASDTVTKFVSADRGAYAIMSLNSAYAGYAESAQRGIMLGDDRKSVLIRDEIRGMTKDTNEVWWFMQMEHVETKISKDGKSATLIKDGVEVHMQVLTDAKDYEIKVLPAKEMVPLDGLPDVDKQTPNTNFTRLAIVFKTGKDVNINVKFAEAGNPKGDTPIKDVALSKWSIPKGVLEAEPVLDGIEIGGVRIPDFVRTQTFYNFELPYGSEECPEVKTFGGDNCTIEIKKPKYLPDYLTITVTSNTDKANQTKYRIYLTVSGPIKVEVSDTPEPQNHAKNLLDGNLKTKWACSGAGWAKFTFPSPQKVDAIWLCAMEMTLRVQPFDIEVSEDGVNFKKVWEGTTTMLPEGSKDQLEEFKIPEGEYKAIRINVTGARYPDGKEYSWSSIFEVMFYYQGKPIEIILQTSDPDSGFTENPNDIVDGGNDKDPYEDDDKDPEATTPDATVPADGTDGSNDGGNASSGMVWLIVGLSAAAVLAAGAIVLVVVLKKKKAAAGTTQE